ncbi:MAG: hypothetical protein M1823_008410, partial [Watsoniomyces obsoletus]
TRRRISISNGVRFSNCAPSRWSPRYCAIRMRRPVIIHTKRGESWRRRRARKMANAWT